MSGGCARNGAHVVKVTDAKRKHPKNIAHAADQRGRKVEHPRARQIHALQAPRAVRFLITKLWVSPASERLELGAACARTQANLPPQKKNSQDRGEPSGGRSQAHCRDPKDTLASLNRERGVQVEERVETRVVEQAGG